MANKKIPITRISKFFGSEDFKLEQSMGMEWLHGDMHFTLVLFRVDSKLSDVDDVYGESGPEEIRYKPPVEFNAYVKIDPPRLDSYAAGLVKDLAKKKLPLPKLPKGASIPLHPSKMKEATWGKLSARQRRKIWRDTANRVNMMEDDLYTAVQTVIYGAGGNVQEMVRRIHSMDP